MSGVPAVEVLLRSSDDIGGEEAVAMRYLIRSVWDACVSFLTGPAAWRNKSTNGSSKGFTNPGMRNVACNGESWARLSMLMVADLATLQP